MLYQSERLPLYAEALERLKAAGLLYPCFCTRAEIAAEIAASASAPQGPDGPLYPGTCRGLATDLSASPHAWRLDVAKATARAGPLDWMDDDTRGAGRARALRRRRPRPQGRAGQLSSRRHVDDAAQGVTDVVRGRDLFAATHVHRLLQALLDLPTPTYHHHALLADAAGNRLAKRHGAPTLAALREAGTDPAALVEALRRGELPAGYSLAQA